MWETVDTLLERAPHTAALRFHRVELLEARRRRAAGLELGDLGSDVALATAGDLAVPALLARVRAAYDGLLVLVKGPEAALDYPAPGLRPFGDLDLLADDAGAAQAALLAAGFQEVGEPSLYEDIHHLRPLWWPGLPLVVELHSRPKWPERLDAPPVAELLGVAVTGRLGVPEVRTLPPAEHALLLAAHAWAHEPFARLGHLLDVGAALRRADAAQVAALARRWGCSRLWRTTHGAVRALLDLDGSSAAVALWGRHLAGVRERTVFEAHLHDWLAPAWGLPRRRVPAAVLRAVLDEGRREHDEGWRRKLKRARMAFANAGVARSEHDLALEARGYRSEREQTA